jgi:hypothetical protein
MSRKATCRFATSLSWGWVGTISGGGRSGHILTDRRRALCTFADKHPSPTLQNPERLTRVRYCDWPTATAGERSRRPTLQPVGTPAASRTESDTAGLTATSRRWSGPTRPNDAPLRQRPPRWPALCPAAPLNSTRPRPRRGRPHRGRGLPYRMARHRACPRSCPLGRLGQKSKWPAR